MDELDIRERGGMRNGEPQFLDRRLFMQLSAFGGCQTTPTLVEALEASGRRFVLGVQWHPEADERSRIVGALVEQAKMVEVLLYRSGRGSE